ncbi:MAG: zinc-ribbon domain-containing protein [Clostridiales bacterium]|nr:zinc-ribbon domain-containing protein [Clostridiales bacterium]
MNCPNCQAEMPDGVKFCPACGSAVAAAPVVEQPEEVSAGVMPIEEAAAEIPAVEENLSSEIPNASFDPGAPIAIPKKKVEEEVPVAPEIAPVESVLPEFPQTEPAPVAVAPIPAPVAEPVAPAPAAPIPAPVALTPETVPAPVSSDKEIQAGASVNTVTDKKSELKALSTGGAFWLMLLFSIPVIGFICSIIFAAVGKKCKSRKNLAKAVLIWKILGIIIALALVIVTYFLFKDIFDAAMSGDMNELSEAITDLFQGS